jgi:hypothetical protein
MTNNPVGYFLHEPVFLKLYDRLLATRNNAQTAYTTDVDNKFSQLLRACLEVGSFDVSTNSCRRYLLCYKDYPKMLFLM